jgi:hypothetical protein
MPIILDTWETHIWNTSHISLDKSCITENHGLADLTNNEEFMISEFDAKVWNQILTKLVSSKPFMFGLLSIVFPLFSTLAIWMY